MNTDDVSRLIGRETASTILSGRYGDASLHSNGFVTGDPCYFSDDAWYAEFSAAAREQQPSAYNGVDRSWVAVQFRGVTCYFKTCSDGVGPFAHCVDAGWVVAVPVSVCPSRVAAAFAPSPVPPFNPNDCGGVFDGNTVTSDADSGL